MEFYYYSESGANQKFEGWFSDRFRDAFLNEKKAFVQCILNGTDSEVTVRDAAAATKISEAAWESYRRKRPKKIPDDEKTEDTDI